MIRDKHFTNAAWMMYDGENKMTRYDADDAQANPTYYLYDASIWGQAYLITILA